MSKRLQAAQAILTSALLDELLEGYRYQVFDQWSRETEPTELAQLHAKASLAEDIGFYIRNKCEQIANDGR